MTEFITCRIPRGTVKVSEAKSFYIDSRLHLNPPMWLISCQFKNGDEQTIGCFHYLEEAQEELIEINKKLGL